MKNNEKMYIIIFDKHANFKEIHVLSKSSDPFVVNPKSVGDSIYIYTQKEFAKLIESATRYLTEPVGESDDSHSNGKATCTLTGGVDVNPKIEINGAEVSKKIFDDFLKAGSK